MFPLVVETAEYFHQTTLQLPNTVTVQSFRERQQSLASPIAAAENVTSSSRGGDDVVISIDEKQPLICRPDQLVTIDTVSYTSSTSL